MLEDIHKSQNGAATVCDTSQLTFHFLQPDVTLAPLSFLPPTHLKLSPPLTDRKTEEGGRTGDKTKGGPVS